jgi:hypothetical protein
LGKRIKNCSKEEQVSFPRGDNHRNETIELGHLKIFFSRSPEPEELIFT